MSKNAEGIVGRKKSDDKFDFYETPSWATELIVDKLLNDGVLNINDTITEPCSGAGAISKVLESKGFKVVSSDIQTADYVYGLKGKSVSDYKDNSCDIVFTNPPYNQMTKSDMFNDLFRITKDKLVLLLNIYYLSSNDRYELLKNSPLKYVYVHSNRVTMFPYGQEKPSSTGTKMFAWFVWEKGYKGEPMIRWVAKK